MMLNETIRWTATMVAFAVSTTAGPAHAEDWRRLMTQGKLDADLGNHDEASAAFRAIADDEAAPTSLRWEALVRLGLTRNAAGDPGASAQAFRSALASYAEDPAAMRFLTYAVASSVPGKIWVDFQEKFEHLLRTARVVSTEELGMGVAGTRKLQLQEGDIELGAIWRPVGHETGPRESRRSEVAAYEIDKVLALGMVPPAVFRTLESQEGALQLWVYGCKTYGSVLDRAPSTPEWRHQLSRMKIFDYRIANDDRNDGNVLVDADWGIVLIDHGLSFSDRDEVVELPHRFDRQIVEKLRQLDRADLEKRLEDALADEQVEDFFRRRDALLARVEELVAERGEQAVLF